jgi:anti-sigma factor RsiW
MGRFATTTHAEGGQNVTTSQPHWDDTHLMAWADGVLPADTATALEAALLQDAELADRAARMQQTREFVREAFNDRLALAPVPQALRESVESMVSRYQPPVPARARPRTAHPWWQKWGGTWTAFALPGAVAASLMVGAVGFLVGQATVAPGDGYAAVPTPVVGGLASAEMATLLNRTPSGQAARVGADGPQTAMVASFTDRQGRLCRDFSLRLADASVESVACRLPGGDWQVVFSALQPPQQGGFSLAGPPSAIDSFLAGIGATEPLSEPAEREALGLR